MSTATSAQRLTTSDAFTYLKTVKEVFRDKKEMYDYFLEVMKDFKAQRIDTAGVIMRVKELFSDRRDLILGFNTFLPRGYEIILPPENDAVQKKKPVLFEDAIGFVNKIKARFQGGDHVYKAFLGILNMYRTDSKSITEVYQEVSILLQEHADLLVEFTHFLPDTLGSASSHHSQLGRTYSLHGDNKDHSLTMATGPQIEKGHHDGFGDQIRSARDDTLIDQVNQDVCSGTQESRSSFCEKVKERLQDSGNYEKFLDCVRSYQRNFLTASQFRKLVANLLETYPDLMEESEDFITNNEKTNLLLSNRKSYRSARLIQEGNEIEREDGEKNKIDTRGTDRYNRGLTSNNTDLLGQRMSLYSKDKFAMKPIHELDLSSCETCTPSYRLLPENYPIPIASRRTKIGVEVLNDHWVSVTSGSEDYSFKHMRKNQYEESLFRCEDDRFELDMLLESVSATAKRVEEMLDSMNSQMNNTEITASIEDHLTAIHLRCIERLYGDHGLDVMDVLMKNAPLALPVILTRLRQKQEEWAKCCGDFNKVWTEIYSKNYHRSLDHRSFYFKQQDAKNLSAKAVLGEIKALCGKNECAEESLLFITAGYKQPIWPDMDFRYADLEIHGDLYQLINHASEEVCTPEQHDKVMNIWTNFLEPLLGLPPHPKSVEEKLRTDIDGEVDVEGKGNFTSEGLMETSMSGDFSGNGEKADPTENCNLEGVKVENGNNDAENETSAVLKTYTTESDMLSDGSGDIIMQAGDCSVVEKNDSDPKNGADFVTASGDVGAVPNQEAQIGVKSMPPSTAKVAEQVKTHLHVAINETISDDGREEGELSPNQNLGVNCQAVQSPHTIAPTTMGTDGEEISGKGAGEETDANANEGEGSVQGSLDGENASENVLHVSDSKNVRESPIAPNEDGVPDRDETDNVIGEGEEDHMSDADETDEITDRLLIETSKPINIKIHAAIHGEEHNSRIFYANDSFYLLLRLHQMLYERMLSAKMHSTTSVENNWRAPNNSVASDTYIRFKEALHSLLDGSSDNAKFEDECRDTIGAQSYVLFTLDKLIHKLVKQLQSIATDEVDSKLRQLYAYEISRNREHFADIVYHDNARFLLPDDNLYRIECFSSSPMRLTIQLMKNEHVSLEPPAAHNLINPDFSDFLHKNLLSVDQERTRSGLFLKRRKRKFSAVDEADEMMEAMEGVIFQNGVEIKVNSETLKATYVLGTEDFFYRTKKRRKLLCLYSKSCAEKPQVEKPT